MFCAEPVPPVDCSPIDSAAGCGTDEQCYVDTSDGTTFCGASGPTAVGGECSAGALCVLGSGCYGYTGEPSTCMEFCDLAGTAHACPTGLTCTDTINSTSWGLCDAA